MTQYAEVIFETGAKSLMSYDSEDELKQFLSEHQDRAKTGRPGAPQDQVERPELDPADFAVMPSIDRMKERPAERIAKVYVYNEHPGDMYNQRISVDTARELVSGMASDDGTFEGEQLVRAVRDEVSPVYPNDQGRLESDYKVDADSELDLAFLDGGDA